MPEVKKHINDMARIMCGHQNNKCPMHHDASCSHIGAEDCSYKDYAASLIRSGYIHISDCEDIVRNLKSIIQNKDDEINRLKTTISELEKGVESQRSVNEAFLHNFSETVYCELKSILIKVKEVVGDSSKCIETINKYIEEYSNGKSF